MTLKRSLVTNDDGVTRETLVDDERVQPEGEKPIGPANHRIRAGWENPGLDWGSWPFVVVGLVLAFVLLAVLAAVVLSGCSPPSPDESRITKPPELGIPDKPKPLAIAWAGTLDVATPYPAKLAGARQWTLVGTGLEWAPVGRTSEIVYLVGPRGISILLPVEWCPDSEATQDVSFHRDWKGRVDYRWTRR